MPTAAMPLAARGAATETSAVAVRSRALSEASAAMYECLSSLALLLSLPVR
jgi:hypothetical protein